MANTVKFYFGTKQAFDSLLNKDPTGLYFVDGLLYRGSELYTKKYRQVPEYPIYGEDNTTYINTSNGSVKYWEDNKYRTLCNPIITKIDSSSSDKELASAKAIYNAIIDNKDSIDKETVDTMITDRLGYMGGASVTDYIKASLNKLIDGAPETLDTFKELATALSDDASLITRLTTLINSKANTSLVRLDAVPITESDLDYKLAQKINNASGSSTVGGGITLSGAQIDDTDVSYSKVYSSQKTENKIKSEISSAISSINFNEITPSERKKLARIEDNANCYIHPLSHSADMIETTYDKQFISAVEKQLYSNKYTKEEVDNLITKITTGLIWKPAVTSFADISSTYPNPKKDWCVSTDEGVYLYTDTVWIKIGSGITPLATSLINGLMSSVDKAKLDHIDANANNYVHPNSHSADIITESATKKFVTPDMYNKLLGIHTQIADTLLQYRTNTTKIKETDLEQAFLDKIANAGGTIVNDDLLSQATTYSSAKIQSLLNTIEKNIATTADIDALF
jgi:hypothetical protein